MKTQLIEKTSKRFKLQLILTWLVMMVGMVVLVLGWITGGVGLLVGIGVFMLGAVWRVLVRLSIWWHHG